MLETHVIWIQSTGFIGADPIAAVVLPLARIAGLSVPVLESSVPSGQDVLYMLHTP